MKRRKLLTLLLCTILIFYVASIIEAVNSPNGCNYIVDNAHLPAYNSYTYYKTSSTPSAADTAISNAISTWNGAVPSMQCIWEVEQKA